MDTVKTWDEIYRNLIILEKYRISPDRKERVFYEGLIKRGKCFVVAETESSIIFGPSRFVGYIDNDRKKHEASNEKDGKVTNKAIDRKLDPCAPDEKLEDKYQRFCQINDIQPYKNQRKYWHKIVK